MQEDYYSDFEIITLNPNVLYCSDDDDDEDSEMEYEDTIAWMEVKSTSYEGEKSVKDVQVEFKMNFVDYDNDEVEMAAVEIDSMKCTDGDNDNNATVVEIKPRKKLNLEEYKIRRANAPAPTIVEGKNVVLELCEHVDILPTIVLPTDPRSIKNLLANNNQQIVVEEENQVNEENNVDEQQEQQHEMSTQTIHPDYEEITLVSIQCNTDITISPNEIDDEESEKSSSFLTNIVNSFQQTSNPKTILNSSTSLLSSINAVLSEKRSNAVSDVKPQSDEHGENKVIMHLRKDRLRPFRSNCEVQTDITPLFPPLILSPSLIFNRIKNARNFRRRSSRSRSRSRSISPEPEYFHSRRSNNYKYSRSVNSSSMNSSDSSSDSDTSAYSSCRSSDPDSLKRYDNRFNKNGYQRPNYKFQEERKIIYVGGLLEETTKDELRRKFLKYGTIKKISLHTKDDGSLRYGFVTFAEANAAYDVLDRFVTDPALCNFDLRFGGRRKFCRETYADLDSLNQETEDIYNNNQTKHVSKPKTTELSFEDLLNMTKRKLCKNK